MNVVKSIYVKIINTLTHLSIPLSSVGVALLFASCTHAGSASDFEKAAKLACDKFKSCAMAQMGDQEGMTPEMQQMIEGMVSGMCDNIMSLDQIPQFDDLYTAAAACMNSMAALSCSQLDDDVKTNECDKYESMAKQYQP